MNLDRREYLHPHELGDGFKLVEQGLSGSGGITTALHVLLAVSSGRGGGDYEAHNNVVGRWGGDRIAIIGDYASYDDLPSFEHADLIYDLCLNDGEVEDSTEHLDPYTNITPMVRNYLERFFSYEGDGWVHRRKLKEHVTAEAIEW